jgi:hypothetical protein
VAVGRHDVGLCDVEIRLQHFLHPGDHARIHLITYTARR